MAIVATILLLAAQGLDVGLHIATGQVEPIRVAASLIAGGGAILILLTARHARLAGIISGSVYLLLNLLFLAQNGMTNPTTDTLRLPLFGFVAVTTILLYWCMKRSGNPTDK